MRASQKHSRLHLGIAAPHKDGGSAARIVLNGVNIDNAVHGPGLTRLDLMRAGTGSSEAAPRSSPPHL